LSSEADFHPASEAERLEAYRNVHDVWSGGLPMEAHLRRRLASVQHNRARWFVACVAGRVVSSLACYPMAFRVQGRVVPGIAIGSVHTLGEFRGRGFAPRLIEWVEQVQRESGAQLSLLYSDIDKTYYERLGYVVCPSYAGVARSRMDAADLPGSPAETTLEPFDAAAERPQLAELYHRCHARRALSIARDDEYWQYLLRKGGGDRFYRVRDRAGERLGYLWISATPSAFTIRDFAAGDSDAALAALLRAALQVASVEQVGAVRGWLPDVEVTRSLFELSPRETEITMLKPLLPALDIDESVTAAAGHFREIDHV
jgi:predicted acetyltransferase